MKTYLLQPLLLASLAILMQPLPAPGQSIMSPFVVLCRNTCGGYGIFRRLCCMVDAVCCTKPDTCPDDTMADTLIPFCQSCTEDVDCFFRSKCCESDGRKCCTAIRSGVFGDSVHQRAKKKKEVTAAPNVTGKPTEDDFVHDEHDEELDDRESNLYFS